jgi:hypothetical protein
MAVCPMPPDIDLAATSKLGTERLNVGLLLETQPFR